MAEYMLRKHLGRNTDWEVRSAGLSAMGGMAASGFAVEMLGKMGIDLSPHRSSSVDGETVDEATVIVVMTAGHRDELLGMFPEAREKLFLLKSFGLEGGDIDDPMGLTIDAYRRVRDEIAGALPDLVSFMGKMNTGQGVV